jgi:hypothetical protein
VRGSLCLNSNQPFTPFLDLLAKAGVQRADEEVLSRAANLAERVGFVSDEIHALKQRSSDREITLCSRLGNPTATSTTRPSWKPMWRKS